MKFTVAPDRVLIKIMKEQRDRLFSKLITNHEGKQVELFFATPAEENEDRRFEQSVHWGTVIAVGSAVSGMKVGDAAILDYLVDASDKDEAGYDKGDKLLSVKALTTYHTSDLRTSDGKRFIHNNGDFDQISPILGMIREDKVIAREPYVIFLHTPSVIKRIEGVGISLEEKPTFLKREVLAVHDGAPYKAGDNVIIHDRDVVDRTYEGKAMQVAFSRDVVAVSTIKHILTPWL
jgi:hypothetical protein